MSDNNHTKTMQTPPRGFIPGTIFAGRYRIMEELGRGGMGVVYKAEDSKLKRKVALKFLPPDFKFDAEVKERFTREAQAAAALEHPNICVIYEIDEAEGKDFISMAYVDGKSLKDEIQTEALTLDKILPIALQVVEGIEEAHKKDIIHRDIKPANIMLTKKGQAVIMDFGLAKISGSTLVTREGTTMGTVAYMSPEQVRGEAVDFRSDIWSFGVVLYEMLSGQLPFKGELESSIMYSIEHKEPQPLLDIKPEIPSELAQVVAKALAKNPQDRYQSMGDFKNDLYSISQGIIPPEISAAMRKAKIEKRKRAYLFGGLGTFLILLIAAGIYLITSRKEVITSIAVMPFENVSGSLETEYLSDGITETIINKLAQLPHLNKVISRDSVFAYKGKQIDPKQVGQELGVNAVLTSRIIHRGDDLSINVSLVKASDNSHIWGKKYTRKFEDILSVEDEIATAITQALHLKLRGEEKQRLIKRYTENTEAYKLYLKAKHSRGKATEDGIKQSIGYLYQALEEDPTYALAYSGLAGTFNMLGYFKLLPPQDAYPQARAAALKALEMDDNLAEAYGTLASVNLFYDWDWIGAEEKLRRATQLNPDLELTTYSYYYAIIGRREDSVVQAERALELNPLSPWVNQYYGMMLLFARRYDQSIEHMQKALKVHPNYYNHHMILGWAYSLKGLHDLAVAETEKAVALSGENPMMVGRLGRVMAAAGRIEESQEILNKMLEQSQTGYVSPYYIAILYLKLNQIDKAFEWLEKAYAVHDDMIIHLLADPDFEVISSDPRYIDMLKKMNLTPSL